MTSPPSAPASLQLLGVTKRFGAAVVVHPLRLRIEGG
jgi:hypothetical protein